MMNCTELFAGFPRCLTSVSQRPRDSCQGFQETKGQHSWKEYLCSTGSKDDIVSCISIKITILEFVIAHDRKVADWNPITTFGQKWIFKYWRLHALHYKCFICLN